jgi:hypothetical protein
MKVAMEVGAIKPWGITGEKCFGVERKQAETAGKPARETA